MMRFVWSFATVLGSDTVAPLRPAPTGRKRRRKTSSATRSRPPLPDKAPAAPKQARKILIFSKTAGFRHGSIPIGARAIAMMGEKTGAYTTLHTEDESIFAPEKLNVFDAVFMLNTTGDCLKPKGAMPKPRTSKRFTRRAWPIS